MKKYKKLSQIEALNTVLSNYAILSQNAKTAHLYIQGCNFLSMHEIYEELYNFANETMDSISERILFLKGEPHSTYKAFLESTSLPTLTVGEDRNQKIQRDILKTLELLSQELYKIIDDVELDVVSEDLLVGTTGELDVFIYKLRAVQA